MIPTPDGHRHIGAVSDLAETGNPMSWTGSFARAVANALYWWGVGWLLYIVTGGDPVPLAQERSVLEEYGPVTLIVIGAIVLNAVITRADRRRP